MDTILKPDDVLHCVRNQTIRFGGGRTTHTLIEGNNYTVGNVEGNGAEDMIMIYGEYQMGNKIVNKQGMPKRILLQHCFKVIGIDK